ncbi:DUF998 domain-containing protein [Falsarthrobacter nasiphocae]|uniref:Membrane protein n=1 Tax=Falsarthrobacter nasiphocae TaxID=189863 RepID=A0AAE3YI41_9MICC|nr:DUF998 domain-containing protein [Falsarthrobacter nasiphocae]MDR6892171.1 putative membrane protein [Falsarthrobacter nasiphocae]
MPHLTSGAETSHRRRLASAARLGLLAAPVLFFALEFAGSLGWPEPGYSYVHNYVSDLGAATCRHSNGRLVCPPHPGWFNAGLIGAGVLVAALLPLVLLRERRRRAPWVWVAAAIVCGAGIAGVGLFPGSYAEVLVGNTTHMMIHGTAAAVGVLAASVLAICQGVGRLRAGRGAGWADVALGAVAPLILGAQAATGVKDLGMPIGVFERLGIYAPILWIAWTAFSARRARPATGAGASPTASP